MTSLGEHHVHARAFFVFPCLGVNAGAAKVIAVDLDMP